MSIDTWGRVITNLTEKVGVWKERNGGVGLDYRFQVVWFELDNKIKHFQKLKEAYEKIKVERFGKA